MSDFQGQTDSILKIKLTSQLLLARWLDAEISPTGQAGLEVVTQFVGEGAPIKITYKDLEGKALGTAEGKVMANCFRTFYKPAGANAVGSVIFEAELPKHNLKKNCRPPLRW